MTHLALIVRESTRGTHLVLVISAVVVFALVLVAAIMWGVRKKKEAAEEKRRVWSELARKRGLAWRESDGPWYRRTSCGIEGAIGGARIALDNYTVSTGKSSTTYTRVKSDIAHAHDLVSSASPRGFWNALGEKLGRAPIRTGDSWFDDAVFLRANDQATALRIIDPEVRRELARFPRRFGLSLKKGGATLTWVGVERNPGVLDAALAIVSGIAKSARA